MHKPVALCWLGAGCRLILSGQYARPIHDTVKCFHNLQKQRSTKSIFGALDSLQAMMEAFWERTPVKTGLHTNLLCFQNVPDINPLCLLNEHNHSL